jgi:hypothetical protein
MALFPDGEWGLWGEAMAVNWAGIISIMGVLG